MSDQPLDFRSASTHLVDVPSLPFVFCLTSGLTPVVFFNRVSFVAVIPNLTTQRNALQMLSNRTQIVLAYVRGVSEGTMKQDPEILRMISGLMAGLPVEEAEEFREEFLTVRFSRSTRPSFSLSPVHFPSLFRISDSFLTPSH